MSQPDTSIKVGDYVRSFHSEVYRDLEGENAYYLEGVVVGFEWVEGCDRYKILVTRDICRGVNKGVDDVPVEERYVFPPVNGTPVWGNQDHLTDGVQKVEA